MTRVLKSKFHGGGPVTAVVIGLTAQVFGLFARTSDCSNARLQVCRSAFALATQRFDRLDPFLFCNISVTRDALVLKHQSEVTQCRETDAPQSTVKLRPEETTPSQFQCGSKCTIGSSVHWLWYR
ncbi:hypothetical protein Poly51_11580 [Rubripirellula tenax]|uniref:Uncharacterized protein n=1 Tax=Rubripirellula tenax TaxID=2528015 RepID=A0A5C6FGL9_9BACT|nr:hypothetical protein Poly51_11580 [Rubripirellula tenax]